MSRIVQLNEVVPMFGPNPSGSADVEILLEGRGFRPAPRDVALREQIVHALRGPTADDREKTKKFAALFR